MLAFRELKTFLSFGARFAWRHPAKWGLLAKHWQEHRAMLDHLRALSGRPMDEVLRIYSELHVQRFYQRVKKAITKQGAPSLSISPHSIVPYCLVRLMKPGTVVETGVEHGISSWLILLAMQRNREGVLYSIDLPNHEAMVDNSGRQQINHLPQGRQPGWLVPEELRGRWHLHLGDAKQVLPDLLKRLGGVDMFIHDSLHSYDHMMFEYRTAWPFIKGGGLLLSDDIGWNEAFSEFVRANNGSAVCFREEAGEQFKGRLGALPKP
ncbi:hypothetical protein YTPLAS18_25340 [Nitrospira sp.]|nr:hypothetical protein YTPLAS18_25340 [Nitrospira sp.]